MMSYIAPRFTRFQYRFVLSAVDTLPKLLDYVRTFNSHFRDKGWHNVEACPDVKGSEMGVLLAADGLEQFHAARCCEYVPKALRPVRPVLTAIDHQFQDAYLCNGRRAPS